MKIASANLHIARINAATLIVTVILTPRQSVRLYSAIAISYHTWFSSYRFAGRKVSNPRDMGRTVSNALGYAPDDEFDPRIDDFVSKERKYVHFDLALSQAERDTFEPSVGDILQNSYWPLIGYVSQERRAKKDSAGNLVFSEKDRPIKFGSHRDAAIFEHYAKSLSIDYEDALGGRNLARSVLAYRSGIGNNINHSRSLFAEIMYRKNCIAIAMDISGFFDNIQHGILYKQILRVRNVERLGDVDFHIFKRMTKFEWVESTDLKKRLGANYGRAGRICYSREFRRLVRGKKPSLIHKNQNDFGIPQGTSLSGLYANISLFEFDELMSSYLSEINGSYRRYSDDLAFLVPQETDLENFLKSVTDALKEIGLAVSQHKTDISRFQAHGSVLKADKPFQYLGFTFDGQRTLIRQSSLSNYYSKMAIGIRAKIRAAKKQGIPADEIYMRELYRKYTHFGQIRNFPRYAYRASNVHDAPEIRAQLRNHMEIFKKCVRNTIASIY